MKNVAAVVWIMVGLLMVPVAEAQSKKKSKEIPTQICKRGKLIFEDDFSGKEIEWKCKEDWSVVNKKLTCKSEAISSISRRFPSTQGYVIEFTLLSPVDVAVVTSQTNQDIEVQLRLSPANQTLQIYSILDRKVSVLTTEQTPKVDGPVRVMCEFFKGEVRMASGNKSASYETGRDDTLHDGVRLAFSPKKTPKLNPVIIDDVKCWEALPKEESEKEGKK